MSDSEMIVTPVFVDSITSCDISASRKGVCPTELPREEVEDTESEPSSSRGELPAGAAD